MSKKKTIFIRCSKVAPKRWKIEQRRKFLWIFEFWQKGAPSLGLDKEFYSNLPWLPPTRLLLRVINYNG